MPTVSAADQVISAILGTQEGAAESGYQLRSTGVTWTDPVEAAALRDALAARKVENVMLVSSFLAAAALAQVVGNSVGYAQTGLLFVEPDTATLALVNTADGSITDVHRQSLTPGNDPSPSCQRWLPAPRRWRRGRMVCSSSVPALTSRRSSRIWRRSPR